MADEQLEFNVRLEQIRNYEFNVRFDEEAFADLLLDEPEPLGDGKGPNASRLVAAAVGNCLSASLLFCARKAKLEPGTIVTEVTGRLERSEKGRLRIGDLRVNIRLGDASNKAHRLERCLNLFEDYCVVTESIRRGIPVTVRVVDGQGRQLATSPST